MSDPLVLVVDDDPLQRAFLERTLAASGFRVLTAGDGQAAIDAAAALRPDVIVLDVMMPRMNGYQACRALRRAPATASVPIILLTSKSEPTDQLWAREVGADAFLNKPVELEELVVTLRRLAGAVE